MRAVNTFHRWFKNSLLLIYHFWKLLCTWRKFTICSSAIKSNFSIHFFPPVPYFNYLVVSKIPTSPLLPGESFSLVCDTKSPWGYSEPKIYWLDPQGREITQATYRKSATSQDNGKWTCVVKSGKTTTKHEVLVTVVGELLCACINHVF